MVRTLLTISLVALPLYLYVGFRLAASVGLLWPDYAARARIIVILVIAWLYILPVGTYAAYALGASSNPFLSPTSVTWADYVLHYPVWLGLIIVVELVLPFLLSDVVGLAARLQPGSHDKLRMILAYVRIGLASLAVVYVPMRAAFDTFRVRDTTAEVQVKGLPARLAGLTITLVGDIQVDQYTGESKVRQTRNIIESHHPEILFSSGDLVTSGKAFLDEAARAVCGLHGSAATMAVLGDHDIWSAPEQIRELHIKCGWDFLDNEHRLFKHRGATILVTGLTHVYSDRLAPEALKRFLTEAPAADLKILLVHQPAELVVRLAREAGYGLLLAGHTHGGQIVFHPLGVPLTASMRETHFYQGIYQAEGTTVVVTRGVGLTLAPLRYHAPAEVTTIILQPQSEPS